MSGNKSTTFLSAPFKRGKNHEPVDVRKKSKTQQKRKTRDNRNTSVMIHQRGKFVICLDNIIRGKENTRYWDRGGEELAINLPASAIAEEKPHRPVSLVESKTTGQEKNPTSVPAFPWPEPNNKIHGSLSFLCAVKKATHCAKSLIPPTSQP